MEFCETNGLYFIFGLSSNQRLRKRVRRQMRKSLRRCHETGEASRRFASFKYRTKDSWSRSRRVICKAEYLPPVGLRNAKANARFIVTNLPASIAGGSQHCYEELYCARGEMENKIKQQKLDLHSDRTSTHWMKSNQFRLYMSAFAYILMDAIRRIGLASTKWARIHCSTIRRRLLKFAANVKITVRRVWISGTQYHPWQREFAEVAAALVRTACRAPPG
jgi:hypothetical protein